MVYAFENPFGNKVLCNCASDETARLYLEVAGGQLESYSLGRTTNVTVASIGFKVATSVGVVTNLMVACYLASMKEG